MKVLYSVAQLREKLYKDGFVCDGIRFCRFKRSSGSSRVGKCLFIDEKLYSRIHKWEMCGLKIKEGQQVDLAALEAYIALSLSSIIGLISIRPENFLVIDDYNSVFKDKVIAVKADSDGWLTSAPEEVEVNNSIWDGQSLIDKSLLGEYEDKGMVLLRNRFFKSACFNCNLQQLALSRACRTSRIARPMLTWLSAWALFLTALLRPRNSRRVPRMRRIASASFPTSMIVPKHTALRILLPCSRMSMSALMI